MNISFWFFGPDSTSLVVEEGDRLFRRTGGGFQERQPVADMGKAFSADCPWPAAGSSNGMMRVWDLAHPAVPREFTVGTGEVWPEVFVGQTDRLLFGRQNETGSHQLDLATG